MSFIINVIKIIILKVFSILPDSPFSEFFSDMDVGFFQYLNWFLPLDICLVMMLAWVDCVIAVFIVLMVKKYVIDTIISAVLSASSAIKFLV